MYNITFTFECGTTKVIDINRNPGLRGVKVSGKRPIYVVLPISLQHTAFANTVGMLLHPVTGKIEWDAEFELKALIRGEVLDSTWRLGMFS